VESAQHAVWQIDGRAVAVSHLDRLWWPDAGVTKGDILDYYRAIAPVLLPYCHDRPVTLRVFPQGATGPSFYVRDRPEQAPAWLRSVAYQPETAKRMPHLPLVDDAAGLIWLVNAGSLELHLWTSRVPDLERPDQAIFDLDPGEAVSFADVRQAALRLRDALERAGVSGYPKTSGGRGLHVIVPIAAGSTFERVRGWVKDLAQALAAAHPALIAMPRRATHQGSRVTIDYAQNSIGRNTAAPYTLRVGRSHPVVSTPLSWDEIAAGDIDPADLTPAIVLGRVRRRGDLFAPVLRAGFHV
jgi:bifunctional non-homologous end joining protein LigD